MIKKCDFHLLQTQLKPQDLTGGLLPRYVADRHRAICRQQAKRPKQAVSWLSTDANSCWQLNQWKLVWCNSNLLSRWSFCQLQVRSPTQSHHHNHHHHQSLCPNYLQSTCPKLSGTLNVWGANYEGMWRERISASHVKQVYNNWTLQKKI